MTNVVYYQSNYEANFKIEAFWTRKLEPKLGTMLRVTMLQDIFLGRYHGRCHANAACVIVTLYVL